MGRKALFSRWRGETVLGVVTRGRRPGARGCGCCWRSPRSHGATEDAQPASSLDFDVTGLQLTVYPASSTTAFVLMETDDSSAPVNEEDGGDQFVLGSPAIADADVERLVLRHSSADKRERSC